MQKIILASSSPRRRQLLKWAEIPFEVVLKQADESYPSGLSAPDVAIHIAKNKALSVKNFLLTKTKNASLIPILAADTIVVLDNQIIGKPADRHDAIKILRSLSGKKHLVITGVCILYKKNKIVFTNITKVEFYQLTTKQIEFYIDRYKPYDKAGAYAIQEWMGVVGIKAIEGDFYNVMGLPISRVVQKLSTLKE